jgi:hypothetical protein
MPVGSYHKLGPHSSHGSGVGLAVTAGSGVSESDPDPYYLPVHVSGDSREFPPEHPKPSYQVVNVRSQEWYGR